MRYYYIEYTMYFEDDYDESEATIIEANNKNQARDRLIENTKEEGYLKIDIDTIYETSEDARAN